MTKTDSETIIIGGGWAGLSAAVKLVAAGHKVRLFESARQFGGRARSVAFSEQAVDNGQHLLLGAYTETLAIMQTCNTDINKVLLRQPLSWKVQNQHGVDVQLHTPRLPAPFNFLYTILFARGYSLTDKLKTLGFLSRLQRRGFSLEKDTSVKQLLSDQPEKFITTFWEPLCIAALNTPIATASAQIFLNVIRDSFTRRASDADALYPLHDLGHVFVQPAIDFIEARGSRVNLASRVDSLELKDNAICAIHVGEERIPASRVILATSASISQRLLTEHASLAHISDKLAQLTYQPICTVYLQYPEDVTLTDPMLGLNDMTGQWVFDRRFAGQPGLIAVVISAEGPHMQLATDKLAECVSQELSDALGWPAPLHHLVVREKRATFSACVDVDHLRPGTTTPVHGLWLAGDYTRSPYPSTLEAAVRSGVQCAQEIIQDTRQTPA